MEIYNCQGSRGKIINVASGSEISINKLVKLIAQYTGYEGTIIYEKERPGDVRRFIASIGLAQSLIKFKPRINLEEGMKLTIEWYKQLNTC